LSEVIPPPAEPQSPSPSLPFRLPADYYNAPVERPPVFPRWVPIGCGSAAALLVVILFIGGALVSRGGIGSIMDFLLGMMQTEMSTMYAQDVPEANRKALGSEMTAFRENIRTGRVPVAKLDPVMSTLREAIGDKKLTSAEVDELRKKIREANTPAPPKR
jgi:hypothetical protein